MVWSLSKLIYPENVENFNVKFTLADCFCCFGNLLEKNQIALSPFYFPGNLVEGEDLWRKGTFHDLPSCSEKCLKPQKNLLEQRLFFLFSSENFVHFCHFEQTRKLFSDPPISKYGAKSLQKTSKIFFFWLIFSCHVKR